MKRLLVMGIRQPGSNEFQFTVYGRAESRFPPAEVQMSLPEFRRWISHSGQASKGGRQLPLLSCHAAPAEE
jgi:hypothetical protein